VLKLQTDIANAVAGALKVSLLGQLAAKIELGGTHNPAALDAYLRGRKAYIARHDGSRMSKTAIAAYTKAIGSILTTGSPSPTDRLRLMSTR